jgi:hypothetical protein
MLHLNSQTWDVCNTVILATETATAMRSATGAATSKQPQPASARVTKAGIAVATSAVKRAYFANLRKISDTLSAGQQPSWRPASDAFAIFLLRNLPAQKTANNRKQPQKTAKNRKKPQKAHYN